MKTQSFIQAYSYRLQSFEQNEILSMIDPATLEDIKAKDSHPYFQAYVLAHEGISQPKILGEVEQKPIHWTKQAIQSLKSVINKGVKFFKGHNKDNSTSNRPTMGEVVSSTLKEIGGKLSHVVVGYFPPESREEAKSMDICSQEAEWNLFEEAGKLIADSVEKLSGIALGNSQKEKPAFSGARRLGFIQAFENIDEGGSPNQENLGNKGHEMSDTINNFHQLVDAVKKFNVHPSQLFSLNDLKKDHEYAEFFQSVKETENKLNELKSKHETLEEDYKKINKEVELSTAQKRLETLITTGELKLTDNQTKFIKNSFDKNKDKIDISDDGLQGYISAQLDNYKEIVGLIKPESPEINAGSGDKVHSDDFTKVENNPLLDEDYTE